MDIFSKTKRPSRCRLTSRLSLESLEERVLLACVDLKSIVLPDTAILSAREVGSSPRYCRVVGRIEQTINFEVRMPVNPEWNGKFLMYGNGGYAGSIPEEVTSDTTALNKGYAIAGTDTGHQGGTFTAAWALGNTKAQEDFAYRAVHLTASTAKLIIELFYTNDISHSYFLGCSNGGRQGLMESLRYPDDFDGIVAGSPAADFTGLSLGFVWNQQMMYPDPASLSRPTLPNRKLSLLDTTVRTKCDGLDGLKDGIIDDPRTCIIEPETDLPICPDNIDGRTCFTNAEIAAIQRIYDGPSNSTGPLFPGYPPGSEGQVVGWTFWMTDARTSFPGSLPPGYPNAEYAIAQELLRYFIFSDPNYQLQDFDLETDLDRVVETARMLNPLNPDLTEFKQSEGKLILYHNWADHSITAYRTIDHYEQVVATMGDTDEVSSFLRFYMLPGTEHCGGGVGPDTVDWLSALERWVEDDIPPDSLVASGGSPYRTRPICPYPQQAIWDGIGDPNVATSFHCGVYSAFSPGDANRDGRFNSADFAQVFQAGEYEDAIEDNSTWEEGDWNGDGDFDSSDFVLAFQTGLY